MASLFKQTTTYDPIFNLLNAEKEEVRDKLTERWRENKIQELNFVGIVVSLTRQDQMHSELRWMEQGALVAGVLTSTGDWPNVLPNGTRSPWTVRACWYCGLIIALGAVVTAAQQAIRLHRLTCHPQHNICIRRLLSSRRTNSDGMVLPRRMQVFAWQMSGWLLMVSALCMLGGMLILIWSSTLTERQRMFQSWWNGDAKLAVTFTIVTTCLIALFAIQQWTLYSFDGHDDSDQRAPGKIGHHPNNSVVSASSDTNRIFMRQAGAQATTA